MTTFEPAQTGRTPLSRPRLEPDSKPERPRAEPWESYEARVLREWTALLDADTDEKPVQQFLERHPCMVPGGRGDVGPGGHHGPELNGLFREARLAGLRTDRQPDFMWVTRASGMITPICVEIEKPGRKWFSASGRPTSSFTSALDQLVDWKLWFSEPVNQQIFRQTYLGGAYDDRQLRPQYLLIYGRISEFEIGVSPHDNPDRLRKKRDFMARADEEFRTFDSLKPDRHLSNAMTLRMRSSGPEVYMIPPTVTTGPATMSSAVRMRNIDAAITRSEGIDPERAKYLSARWSVWRDQADKKELRVHGPGFGE